LISLASNEVVAKRWNSAMFKNLKIIPTRVAFRNLPRLLEWVLVSTFIIANLMN
jgi:hypothetical protein